MPVDIAFLRGINLGRRRMKMADLADCLSAAGFKGVKTILASGNVRFERAGPLAETRQRLEAAIEKRFGFHVGAVLRQDAEIAALLAARPFAHLDAAPGADIARHVLFFSKTLPPDLVLEGRPGHTEIVQIASREIFLACYRQANGRYTEEIGVVLKPLYARLAPDQLDTMRNWNTIEKVLP